MNRNLSSWAMIAEIVSGIAVVITVIFLVIGIRENTAITRAAMFDSTMHGLAEFRGHVIENADVAELWIAYLDREYDQLDRTSQIRSRQLVMLAFENYQRAYYARRYGVLGESEWTRKMSTIDAVERLLLVADSKGSRMCSLSASDLRY